MLVVQFWLKMFYIYIYKIYSAVVGTVII